MAHDGGVHYGVCSVWGCKETLLIVLRVLVFEQLAGLSEPGLFLCV